MKKQLAGTVGGVLCALVALDAGAADAKGEVSANASADLSGTSLSTSMSGAGAPAEAPDDRSPAWKRNLEQQSTLNGSTGLLRTVAADSGAPGTLRVGLILSYFESSGFLCPSGPTCRDPRFNRLSVSGPDSVSQIAERLLVSVTPLSFLEAYGAFHSQSTSDDKGSPQAIQIVGDTTLGVKAFMPTARDRMFTFGGAADVEMLSSAGDVGVHTANVGLRALGTMDFTRQGAARPVPLRLHLNVGYLFDQSGTLADDIEASRDRFFNSPQHRITTIERFSHGINRVDTLRTGLGVEGAFEWFLRPFLEWSIDLPVNRQSHECGGIQKQPGDGCLSQDASLKTMPSRLTAGVRYFPWHTPALEGTALLLAFDVGTGATGTFIEEVAPERPWAIHLGLAYAFDTQRAGGPSEAPKVVERMVPAPPPPERYIEGVVTRAGKDESLPIPGAIVRYEGRSLTGMVTDDQGKFRTQNLEPGEYKFSVSADGFRDNECTGVIPAPEAPKAPSNDTKGGPFAPAPAAAAPAAPVATGPVVAHVTCALEPLPKTATITGTARDAETTEFVGGAKVTITDPLGRELSLQTDGEGAFRFGNVVAGKSTLAVDAEGYLRASVEVTVEPRRDVSTQILLYKKPKTPNVVVTATEVKLKKEIHFLHGSAEILPDSMAILEEAADVLRSHPELTNIEVQGHTDDTGTPEFNLKLSADRANAVRQVFIMNGVDAARLSAHGYGQEKPLVPNTSPKNRAKNRRVQLVIVK